MGVIRVLEDSAELKAISKGTRYVSHVTWSWLTYDRSASSNRRMHTLRLAISLRVIGRRRAEFGSTRLEKIFPEVAQEFLVTVGHHSFGKTVMVVLCCRNKVRQLLEH